MKVCSSSPQRHNNSISSLGRALQWDSLAPSPITDIIPLPRPSASGFVPPGLVKRVCDQRRNKWRRTGWLLARAGFVSPCCKVVFMVYVLLCWGVFFLFSHCTPQWSIVWGLKKKLSSLSSCNAVIFFNSLSSCPVYPLVCMLCMGRWMAYFTGTCD